MVTDRFLDWPNSRREDLLPEVAVAPAIAQPTPTPADPAANISELSVTADVLPDMVHLRLAGHLDVYTAPDFNEYAWRYDPDETQLVVDLTDVTLLDSTGMGALMVLRNRARRKGSRIGIVCPDADLSRIFWYTGARPAFAFGDGLPAVRAALALASGSPVPAVTL